MKTATGLMGMGRQVGHRAWAFVIIAVLALAGCRSKPTAQNKEFFTSGSKEADQRASQRMAKSEQLEGSGEGAGEKGVKKGAEGAAQATNKLSLYQRLGGEQGISALVDDFIPRLMQDPRVNWRRENVKHGLFSGHKETYAWTNSPQNVATLKKHMVQFLALATGGPATYEGKEIQGVHANMHISNAEFDAATGDIKASLDKLKVPNKEQKELLAIIESTRPQIVTAR